MISRIARLALDRWRIARDPVAHARRLGVTVGSNVRLIGLQRGTFGSEPYLVRLGSHVTVTAGVSFVTHDGGVWVLREEFPEMDVFGEIVVGDNCFIGLRAILLPGVTIGDNCVIAAGAVVNRDIPANSVAAGVPARVVSSFADYRERSLAKALHVRNLPSPEREAAIREKFSRRRASDSF